MLLSNDLLYILLSKHYWKDVLEPIVYPFHFYLLPHVKFCNFCTQNLMFHYGLCFLFILIFLWWFGWDKNPPLQCLWSWKFLQIFKCRSRRTEQQICQNPLDYLLPKESHPQNFWISAPPPWLHFYISISGIQNPKSYLKHPMKAWQPEGRKTGGLGRDR